MFHSTCKTESNSIVYSVLESVNFYPKQYCGAKSGNLYFFLISKILGFLGFLRRCCCLPHCLFAVKPLIPLRVFQNRSFSLTAEVNERNNREIGGVAGSITV